MRVAARLRVAAQDPSSRKHTEESKQKMREKAKTYRDAETDAQKETRRLAHRASWSQRDDNAEAIRRAKISAATSGSMRKRLGDDALANVVQRRAVGFRAWWRALSAEEKAQLKEKRRLGQLTRWAKFTQEEARLKQDRWRRTMVKNGGHRRFVSYQTRTGDNIILDGGWEPGCYKLLERLGVNFRYVNQHAIALPMPYGTWHPDFILDDLNLIVEVKGWRGLPRFHNRILPGFKNSEFAEVYSVALCRFDAGKRCYSDIDAFLKDVDFVHVATKHNHCYRPVPHGGNIMSASGELLGSPESRADHNVAGNGKRDGLKTARIGQSAAKLPKHSGEGSTTREKSRRAQARSKCRSARHD